MRLERNQLLTVLSEALDCVEKEVLGVTDYHAKRVAWLCICMGRRAGMKEAEISDLAIAALLHDNALNEYKGDYTHGVLKPNATGKEHCIAGESNFKLIPGCEEGREFVLYHHECADGSGPFGKKEAETPLGAQLVHIADEIDLTFSLGECSSCDFDKISIYVKEQQGKLFSEKVAELFLDCLTRECFEKLSNESIETFLPQIQEREIGAEKGIAELFARIIDYKSPFTKEHSIGIAEKAEQMARHLGYEEERVEMLYMAGAFHDIGKLFVNKDILEKPGRLNDEEYLHIQSHAYETYRLLSKIAGFAKIRDWASFHHEKLNGKGYPFGKRAEELTEETRLLACLDIYQALTEDRPYKSGMSHSKAISILRELAEREELDAGIVEEIDKVFGMEKESREMFRTALFQCPACGYIYEGDVVPNGYECPVCGQPEHRFYRIQ